MSSGSLFFLSTDSFQIQSKNLFDFSSEQIIKGNRRTEEMDAEKLVSITISIPKVYRDQLRRMIAESNLKNPDEVTSLSELGRQIFCEYLKNLVTDV
jgi:hypothetical protein